MDIVKKLTGRRVLIVDDEPDILETLEELLDMCTIDTAVSYEAAEKFLKKDTYDAAILDIMGVRGLDLLKIASEKKIPTLMLTAHALSPENLVKSIQTGALAYVPKDKLADIAAYVADIMDAKTEKTAISQWFSRLKPFFDKKFKPGWQKKDEAFWREFDRKNTVVQKDGDDSF